jgi:hypothetical protein
VCRFLVLELPLFGGIWGMPVQSPYSSHSQYGVCCQAATVGLSSAHYRIGSNLGFQHGGNSS